MTRWALVAGMATCAPFVTPSLRYTGNLVPETRSTDCQPGRAVLQIRNGSMLFVPDEGIWVLEGGAGADGGLLAVRSTIGVDKKPYDTRFEGNWTRARATGVYRTPRCAFNFDGVTG